MWPRIARVPYPFDSRCSSSRSSSSHPLCALRLATLLRRQLSDFILVTLSVALSSLTTTSSGLNVICDPLAHDSRSEAGKKITQRCSLTSVTCTPAFPSNDVFFLSLSSNLVPTEVYEWSRFPYILLMCIFIHALTPIKPRLHGNCPQIIHLNIILHSNGLMSLREHEVVKRCKPSGTLPHTPSIPIHSIRYDHKISWDVGQALKRHRRTSLTKIPFKL